MNQTQAPQMNIDLKNTTSILSKEGNQLFAEGVILRKVSKFVTGTSEDGIMPIPVFYDIKTGEILTETLPKELREEFESESSEQD
jgi:hypothetical protein|tara:strand:- start:1554 stop:1808 length:255 start_codon:yes stop_codon:yes gene_type:complete